MDWGIFGGVQTPQSAMIVFAKRCFGLLSAVSVTLQISRWGATENAAAVEDLLQLHLLLLRHPHDRTTLPTS